MRKEKLGEKNKTKTDKQEKIHAFRVAGNAKTPFFPRAAKECGTQINTHGLTALLAALLPSFASLDTMANTQLPVIQTSASSELWSYLLATTKGTVQHRAPNWWLSPRQIFSCRSTFFPRETMTAHTETK